MDLDVVPSSDFGAGDEVCVIFLLLMIMSIVSN